MKLFLLYIAIALFSIFIVHKVFENEKEAYIAEHQTPVVKEVVTEREVVREVVYNTTINNYINQSESNDQKLRVEVNNGTVLITNR